MSSQPDVLGLLLNRVRSGSRPGQRDDGYRIALCIEGGGMRGTVSAGMALALQERGFLPAFDAVYGSSAGAITGACAGQLPARRDARLGQPGLRAGRWL
jgi:predicted acylesterase/phospholipase RssA